MGIMIDKLAENSIALAFFSVVAINQIRPLFL
jgi:hypothetical protein